MQKSFMARFYAATAVACLLTLCLGTSSRADDPYSAQSAKAPDQPTPSSYDLDRVSTWTQQLNSASNKDLAKIVRGIAAELLGSRDGNYKPPIWFGVSSITGCTSLVPGLVRALHAPPSDGAFMPQEDAAYCLERIGPVAATKALPAMLEFYTSDLAPPETMDLYQVSYAITRLCGGDSKFGAGLAQIITSAPDPDEQIEAINAITNQYVYSISGFPGLREYENPVAWMDGLDNAYAECDWAMAQAAVADANPKVRIAALRGLRSSSFDRVYDWPGWIAAQPKLARILSDDSEPIENRRIAAYVLCRLQCSPMPILPQVLQAVTDKDDTVRSYAILILSHAEQTDAAGLQNAMLAGLLSQDLSRRRQSAAELRYGVSALWGYSPAIGSIGPKQDELTSAVDNEQINGPFFYTSRLPSSQPPVLLTTVQQHARRAALVSELVQAVSDTDMEVGSDAELALERIAQDTLWSLGMGGLWTDTQIDYAHVVDGLNQAAHKLDTSDPAAAARLRKLASPESRPTVAL